jgi:hypothetical protein
MQGFKSKGEKENDKNLNLQKEFLTENINDILECKTVEYFPCFLSVCPIYFYDWPCHRYFGNRRRNTYRMDETVIL